MLSYWIWYSLLPGMNGRQKLQLLEQFHSPEGIFLLDDRTVNGLSFLSYKAKTGILNKDLSKANSIIKSCTGLRIGILAFFDSGFPSQLRSIDDPPMVLYYRGELPAWQLQPLIGVVGTRKASGYGLRATQSISAQIAACGGIVVSGGAFGIDSKALESALEQGQKTVAIMAAGLDELYPKGNEPLFHKVMESGCILSENPPGTRIFKGEFLRRNRLISGISNGVLVVEAPEVSGALNTARWAVEQGRDVYAVPGNIDSENSAGSNGLIGDVAQAVTNGWAIMHHYQPLYPDTVRHVQPRLQSEKQTVQMVAQQPKKPVLRPQADKINVDKPVDSPYSVKENVLAKLSPREKEIVLLLTDQPVPVDQIAEKLQQPLGEVLKIVTKLSVMGVVKSHPGKLISLN